MPAPAGAGIDDFVMGKLPLIAWLSFRRSVADFLALGSGLSPSERLHFEGVKAQFRPLTSVCGLPGMSMDPAFNIDRASMS